MKNGLASVKKEMIHRYMSSWQYLIVLALLVSLLAFVCPWGGSVASARVVVPSAVSVSPSQGPVGTIVTVSATNVFANDGTQLQLGYMPGGNQCTVIPGSQSITVKNRSFSSSFQWPMTAAGTFGICTIADHNLTFQIASFNVLSASPAQIAVAPKTLDAGAQAKVTGKNFLPSGTSVNLTWRSSDGGQSTSLGAVISDGTGSFSKTFSIPTRSSTGSYVVEAATTGTQTPALSASANFHVNGVTILPVATPTVPSGVATAEPSPTARVSPTVSTPIQSIKNTQPTKPVQTPAGAFPVLGKTGPLLLIAGTGLILIVVVLIAGVFLVHRQRALQALASSAVWSGPPAEISGGAFVPELAPYAATTMVFPVYPDSDGKHPGETRDGGQSADAFSLDPVLVEAIREAQVSLFALPRPPIEDKVPS